MSMVYGGLSVWPDVVYYPAYQAYECRDYGYPYVQWYAYPPVAQYYVPPMVHVDMPHYPMVGEDWYGMHIHENCRYCGQPLIATSDRRVNYCPSCGRTQWHRL
jgi:hypothetical protein